jgi:hypothetical protein
VEVNNVSETVENQINKIVVVNKHSKTGKKGKGDEDDGSVQEDVAGFRAQRRANRKGAFAAGKKLDMGLGNDNGLLSLLSPNILDGVEMTKPNNLLNG